MLYLPGHGLACVLLVRWYAGGIGIGNEEATRWSAPWRWSRPRKRPDEVLQRPQRGMRAWNEEWDLISRFAKLVKGGHKAECESFCNRWGMIDGEALGTNWGQNVCLGRESGSFVFRTAKRKAPKIQG